MRDVYERTGKRKGTAIYKIIPIAAARTERILFMLDGNIVSEKALGKYEKEKGTDKAREEKLSSWLLEMGF